MTLTEVFEQLSTNLKAVTGSGNITVIVSEAQHQQLAHEIEQYHKYISPIEGILLYSGLGKIIVLSHSGAKLQKELGL